MTLLWFDGFDMGDYAFRYAATSGSLSLSTTTRFSVGRSLALTTAGQNFFTRTFTPMNRMIVGIAAQVAGGHATNQLIQTFGDNGVTNHINLLISPTGQIAITRGSTQIAATAASLVQFNVWNYIELSATISDTVGVAKARLNGVEVLSFTGDTKNAGTASTLDTVSVGSIITSGFGTRVDDLYVSDDTGSAPYNDFLGDVRVCTLSPTAPGATTQLTPSVAPNWGCVDEQPYSATDYVTGALAALKDTYTMQDLPAGITVVHSVQPGVVAKKSDAGARSLKTIVRSGGTDYAEATAQVLGTSDGSYRSLRPLNPNGGVSWTPASVNAMEVGVEVA